MSQRRMVPVIWLALTLDAARRRIRQAHAGQGLVEYALILVLIAIATIAVMTGLGAQITAKFQDILTALGG